ncbi:MAG TPA: hypothetical protein VIJ38_19465 [Acidobacteriaceae bacterium]
MAADAQQQQLAAIRDSWGYPRIPKNSEEKTGYADLESKERFPHPHSLYDGGEIRETHHQIGIRGVSRLLLNQK